MLETTLDSPAIREFQAGSNNELRENVWYSTIQSFDELTRIHSLYSEEELVETGTTQEPGRKTQLCFSYHTDPGAGFFPKRFLATSFIGRCENVSHRTAQLSCSQTTDLSSGLSFCNPSNKAVFGVNSSRDFSIETNRSVRPSSQRVNNEKRDADQRTPAGRKSNRYR